MSEHRRILRVGLTGGIASGKTTVAHILAEHLHRWSASEPTSVLMRIRSMPLDSARSKAGMVELGRRI